TICKTLTTRASRRAARRTTAGGRSPGGSPCRVASRGTETSSHGDQRSDLPEVVRDARRSPDDPEPDPPFSFPRSRSPVMRRIPSCALAALLGALGTARAAAPAPPDDLPEKVTFSEHVAPLVFTSCTGCHRPGEAAPFSLLNYRDVQKHARTM